MQLTFHKKYSIIIRYDLFRVSGDCVIVNKKTLIAAIGLALTAAAGIFAFCSLQGKYAFMGEPQLQLPQVTLEKKALKSRERVESELQRDKLPTEAQRRAYDVIKRNTFSADDDRFQLKDTGKDDLQMALSAIRADHREVFWIDPNSSYKYYEDGGSVTVELHFTETGGNLQQDRKTLEAAVKKAVSGAPDNASDYEIELYLNDYLSEHCTYDAEGERKHSAYGALVEGRAVCDGYSRAFQLLCRRLGIECTVVEGTSEFNTDEDDGHMWNCVRIGGEWYHADITWNDAENASCGAEHYFYLNLTEEEIKLDHVISGSYDERSDNKGNYFNIFVPSCGTDDLNYMRLNYVTIKDLEDDGQIIAALADAARKKSDYCAFLISEDVHFETTTKAIADKYAAQWVQGANRFIKDGPAIMSEGHIINYKGKRVTAFKLAYRE